MKRLLLALWLVVATVYATLILLPTVPTESPTAGRASAFLSSTFEKSNSPQALRNQEQVPGTQNGVPAPLVNPEEPREASASSGSESENDNMGWVEVSRAARVHAGPSVTAPTLRFYPVGMELHFMEYEQGWFQVANPTTSERGWIYEKYIEAIRAPGQTHTVSQPAPQPTPAAVEVSAPRKPLVRAKAQQQEAEQTQPRARKNELFASLLETAFRGH